MTKVIYNLAGQSLRAARTTPYRIADNSTFHLTASTSDEAAYLVAVLNADCLQQAYQARRKSDHHFAHHIWRAVPIPRYDAGNAQHRALAALCVDAEKAAAGVRDGLPADAGQIRLCEAIRRELRAAGIAGAVDAATRAILPRHSA